MRALHVYSGNLYGGIETLLVTLARVRRLSPEMKAHFALCFNGRLSDELTRLGVPVHHVGEVRISRPTSVMRARRALADLLQRTTFDVVVAHSPWCLLIFAPPVRHAALPLVLWLHNPTRSDHWMDGLARRIVPDLIVCNSQYTANRAAVAYPETRVTWVYSPVAPPATVPTMDGRASLRATFRTSSDAVVILQASRLEPWKGHLTHLGALGTLRDVAGWVAWIAGGAQRAFERKYLDTLRRTAQVEGISDRVRFIGHRSDMPAVLAAADIYCQPNAEAEPFGLVLVEALLAGRPVVASAVGGPQEILDETCGLLVAPNDSRALRAALERLVTDKALRYKLGAGGPGRARSLCDPATQMPKVYEALSQVLTHEVA